jgi:hypothetical protein
MLNSASVSKDGRAHDAEHHPSRRGEDAAPRDEVQNNFAVLPDEG